MAYLALQPVSSNKARENELKTLRISRKIDELAAFLSEDEIDRLRVEFPEGRIPVWGVKAERAGQWGKMLNNNTLVLFRREGRVKLRGIVAFKVMNPELAMHLWGPDDDGELWSLIYFIRKLKKVDISASEAKFLGRGSGIRSQLNPSPCCPDSPWQWLQ